MKQVFIFMCYVQLTKNKTGVNTEGVVKDRAAGFRYKASQISSNQTHLDLRITL